MARPTCNYRSCILSLQKPVLCHSLEHIGATSPNSLLRICHQWTQLAPEQVRWWQGQVVGNLGGDSERGGGRARGSLGWERESVCSSQACWILSLFPRPNLPPSFPHTYANEIADMNPRSPIGDQAAYWEVSKHYFYIPTQLAHTASSMHSIGSIVF